MSNRAIPTFEAYGRTWERMQYPGHWDEYKKASFKEHVRNENEIAIRMLAADSLAWFGTKWYLQIVDGEEVIKNPWAYYQESKWKNLYLAALEAEGKEV